MRRQGLIIGFAAFLSAAPALAQEGQSMRVTLPPQRPFDLDLEGTPKLPPIVVPPARMQAREAPARETPAAEGSQETPERRPRSRHPGERRARDPAGRGQPALPGAGRG